ncbi:MAG: hypothetical protein P8P30_03935 [Rickettsiales bacterium]|nr:hypothetical protein [Rickettsiales bacterium]
MSCILNSKDAEGEIRTESLAKKKYLRSNGLKFKSYVEVYDYFINILDPQYFITIAFNPDKKSRPIKKSDDEKNQRHDKSKKFRPEIARRYYSQKLKYIFGRMDRKLVGKTYQHPAKRENRCEGLAIPEHQSSNFHYHILLTNQNHSEDELHNAMDYSLTKLRMDYASYDIQKIWNVEGLKHYSLKEFYKRLRTNDIATINNIAEQFILLGEFHSEH